MPKTKVPPQPLPFWDALLAEHGDPRPYDATEIAASYVVPDDAFAAVTIEYEAGRGEVDHAVDDLASKLDDALRDAHDVLDALVPLDEARRLLDVRDACAVTQVLPRWPYAEADDATVDEVSS